MMSSGFPIYGPGIDWCTYRKQIDHYFTSNVIVDSKKQKAMFISQLPSDKLDLILALIGQERLVKVTIKDIYDALDLHFRGGLQLTAQRRSFFRRDKIAQESIDQYAKALKNLAAGCVFGSELNSQLTKYFVMGLGSSRLIDLLKPDLDNQTDFDSLVQRACALECVIDNETDDVSGQSKGCDACAFRDVNCAFQGTPYAMEQHMSATRDEHLVMIKDFFLKVISEQETTIEKLRDDLDCALFQSASFVWCIEGVDAHIKRALQDSEASITSPSFYSHNYGYKLQVVMYLNNDNAEKTGVFVYLKAGDYDAILPWPMRREVTVTLHNRHYPRSEHESTTFRTAESATFDKPPRTEAEETSYGFPRFVTLDRLMRRLVKNDRMHLIVKVK